VLFIIGLNIAGWHTAIHFTIYNHWGLELTAFWEPFFWFVIYRHNQGNIPRMSIHSNLQRTHCHGNCWAVENKWSP